MNTFFKKLPALIFLFLTLSSSAQECLCDLDGTYDAVTTVINTNSGIGWDQCEGNVWEGVIDLLLESNEDGETYVVSSLGPDNLFWNDPSFGAYYACYGTSAQASLPNSEQDGSLRFESNCGFSFRGSSQWGEVFSVDTLSIIEDTLRFIWSNDYGEAAMVVLTRQDELNWIDKECQSNYTTESDSLALVALYNNTDGENWFSVWDLTEPVEKWHGITLDDNSRVSNIALDENMESGFPGNNLNGEIPIELSQLEGLVELDLANNRSLSGPIPSELGQLNKLEILRFFNCNLTGTIPPELGQLENLSVLSLSVNDLEGPIPIQLGSLSNLTRIFLGFNRLEGEIPDELGNLTSLNVLALNANQLSGEIPASFENLKELTNLTLYHNDLSGNIPEYFVDYQNLSRLDLSYNNFGGSIPEGFHNLSELIHLRLSNNNLEGSIPEDLALSDIFVLQLNDNNFTGAIPSFLFSRPSRTQTLLHNNDLSGCVEDVMSEICAFQVIDMPNDTFLNATEELPIYNSSSSGISLSGNPKLAWGGDMTNWCNGEEQIGASCEDGDPLTFDDAISEDCSCQGQTSSVNEIEHLTSLSIVPNPTSTNSPTILLFELSKSTNLEIKLLDVQGQELFTTSARFNQGQNQSIIKTDKVIPGFYIVQINDGSSVAVRKLVVE